MLLLLFRALSIFPLSVLHAGGALLGRAVWLLSPSYRQRFSDNLRRAGHELCGPQAIAQAGKSLAELPFVWCARPERVLSTVTLDNWPAVQAVMQEGRGALFLTPHLGCFEIIPQYIASFSPSTVMYRPPRKPALRPLLEQARKRPGLALAPANLSGVKMLLKALRRGELVGLLPDQVPQQGEGTWAPFFGKPAYTMTLPARLVQMTGAPIILTWGERLSHGAGFLLHFEPYELPAGSVEEQTAALNREMERLIARCPQQYFWSYNRYKTPAGIAPASAPATGVPP